MQRLPTLLISLTLVAAATLHCSSDEPGVSVEDAGGGGTSDGGTSDGGTSDGGMTTTGPGPSTGGGGSGDTPGEVLWASRASTPDDERAYTAAVFADGRTVVAGTVDTGVRQPHLRYFGDDGQPGGVVDFQTSDDGQIDSVADAGADAVVMSGTFRGDIDFGNGAIPAQNISGFIVKLASDRSVAWAHVVHHGLDPQSTVSATHDANVLWTFWAGGITTLPGDIVADLDSGSHLAVLEGDTGTTRWTRPLGSAAGVRVGTFRDGDIALCARVFGTTPLGGGLDAGDSGAIVVARLTTDGDDVWARLYEAEGDALCTGIAVGADDTIGLAISSSGSVDFGGGALGGGDAHRDMVVAELDGVGDHLWSRAYGGDDDVFVRSVTVDSEGNLLATGFFSGSADLGEPYATGPNGAGCFVIKVDGSGTHQWSHGVGGPAVTCLSHGVGVDSSDAIQIGGVASGAFVLGDVDLSGFGSLDFFVAKFAP